MDRFQEVSVVHHGNPYHFRRTFEPHPKYDDYYRHCHANYELYVFFEGNLDFVIEDKVYKLQPNVMLLIPPYTYHYAALHNPDEPYHRLIINFSRIFVYPELQPVLDSAANPSLWNAEKHGALLRDLEENFSRYKHGDCSLLVQFFVNRLLMDLKYMQKSPAPSETLHPTVSRILSYVNEHIREPLSLKTIAQNTFLNPSHLSQIFSAYMKISVMDYVKQKKIYLAEELIREERRSPTEASRELGFGDYSTFYRLYKKYMHATPSSRTENP